MKQTANYETSLEQAIATATQLIATVEARAFQQEDFSELSMRQVSYMDAIARLGHPSFSELAEALGISRPSVTVLVGKLIRKGFIEKVQDGDDRRSFHILLTEKGRQFTHIHENMHRQIVETLIGHLDEKEVEQLAVLLKKAIGT